MNFKFGDRIQIGGDSDYQLTSIEGLSAPDIRTASNNYSGLDGGYVSAQLFGMREITLTGFYIGKTCEQATNLRVNLMSQLIIRYLFPVMITTFDNQHFFCEGYITDIKTNIDTPKSAQFQITLTCPDPLIYDGGDGKTSDSAWMEQLVHKEIPGGFVIKYHVPVPWDAGQPVSIIKNMGSIYAQPIITLRGIYHNPRITNMTTNKFMQINYNNPVANDVIEIDMKDRTIIRNGGSIMADRTTDSSWFTLEPGDNKLVLTTNDDKNDMNYVNIKWKNGFMGI